MYGDRERRDIGVDTILAACGLVVLILALVGILCYTIFRMVDTYAIKIPEFNEQVASNPVLVDATVKNDTGSAIILEDRYGNRIVVGNTDVDEPGDIGYEERAEAYVNSTGVQPGDKVVVEARGDFYSNIRVLEDEHDDSDTQSTVGDIS